MDLESLGGSLGRLGWRRKEEEEEAYWLEKDLNPGSSDHESSTLPSLPSRLACCRSTPLPGRLLIGWREEPGFDLPLELENVEGGGGGAWEG